MNELVIKSEKGNPITTSRLVASKFIKRHADILRAIENLECSKEFTERNFALVEINYLQNSSPIITNQREYIITRDGFSFLVMGFTGKEAATFKEEFIEAFNNMEQSLKNQLPNDYLSALKALVVSEEAKQLAETQVKELAPKAEVFDNISNAINLLSMNDAAKALNLGFGRNKLFELLREYAILRKNNTPYQEYIDKGYFEVKVTAGSTFACNFTKTYVTGKGLTWLSKMLTKNIISNV